MNIEFSLVYTYSFQFDYDGNNYAYKWHLNPFLETTSTGQ